MPDADARLKLCGGPRSRVPLGAQAGIRDRRGRIHEFTEVLQSRDGMLFEATWAADKIDGRFLPVEIPITDSVSHIFIDSRDADEHYESVVARPPAAGR